MSGSVEISGRGRDTIPKSILDGDHGFLDAFLVPRAAHMIVSVFGFPYDS